MNNVKNNKKQKITSTTKTILFAGLIMTLMIPVTGINVADAVGSNPQKPNIGKVSDGTYDEKLAFEIASELITLYEEKMQGKQELENALTKINTPSELKQIEDKISQIQNDINIITQEYDEIQNENMKLYYIEPSLYDRYVTAKDVLVNTIQKQYWEGKSFEEAKNTFPLVGAGINHKEKSVEISLSKDIENSSEKFEYISVIDKLMPEDIPWFITYEDYPTPTSCASRTSPCDPLIGGIDIHVGLNLLDGSCTLGIEAVRNGLDGFITAGHCADGKAFGTSVYQPTLGTDVGSLQIENFFHNSSCDCAFVADRPGNPIMDNAIFQSGTSTYTPVTATSSGGQAGQMVKKSGVVTGNTLGTVTSTSVSKTYGGNTITNLVKTTLYADCGDSGSPVTNGLGTSFYGILVAKDGLCGVTTNVAYHSPYEQITSQIGANPVLG